MTQTTIQKPGAIRWGSAKVEVKNDSGVWVDLGAIKSLKTTTTTTGGGMYKPDNTPPKKIDPIEESWEFAFDLEEAWDAVTLQLLRGEVDTYTDGDNSTIIGVGAGTGERPSREWRLTNTTPGQAAAVISLLSVCCTSSLDWTYPADADNTTAVSLPVTLSAVKVGTSGFGTIEIPDATTNYTITPASVSVAVGATQALTVSGTPDSVTYGILNAAVATISSSGVITGVAAGTTSAVVTIDDVVHLVAVAVTAT